MSQTEDVDARRVADPEEFNQTERLRAINEVRRQAGETIQATMTQLRTDAEFDASDRQQILRAAVMRYLTNIEWLAHQAEHTELINDMEFGTVTLNPPAHLVDVVSDKSRGYPRVVGSPDLSAERWTIRGINGFLTAPEVFEATWTLTVDTRHDGPQRISETRTTFMPAHVSFNAFRMANQFLSKQGIDVDLADEQHRAVVDASVMKEVEEWRKQNIK
jgi:hypothetical protein